MPRDVLLTLAVVEPLFLIALLTEGRSVVVKPKRFYRGTLLYLTIVGIAGIMLIEYIILVKLLSPQTMFGTASEAIWVLAVALVFPSTVTITIFITERHARE